MFSNIKKVVKGGNSHIHLSIANQTNEPLKANVFVCTKLFVFIAQDSSENFDLDLLDSVFSVFFYGEMSHNRVLWIPKKVYYLDNTASRIKKSKSL